MKLAFPVMFLACFGCFLLISVSESDGKLPHPRAITPTQVSAETGVRLVISESGIREPQFSGDYSEVTLGVCSGFMAGPDGYLFSCLINDEPFELTISEGSEIWSTPFG